ncbi:MAG: hypothetical protein NVS1B10_07600 [Candidatus Saccharimonadales bacterium]
MHYRGLEEPKIVQEGAVILGHTRLPIINLGRAGNQPMQIDGVIGAFVGEILNYKELDPDAYTDTEVLIKTFVRSGLNGFHHFDGFWAAIFIERGEAVVVTDYLGQKPLYFHEDSLLVASEPEAIIAALDYKLALDRVYFSNVLKWGYDPTGRTPYQGVTQVPAGVALSYHQGVRFAPAWDWLQASGGDDLRTLMVKSVQNRLVSNRPVALLLSGGLDSTIVFKIITEILERPAEVFHVENNEGEYLEKALAGWPSRPLPCPKVPLKEAVLAHQVPVDLGSMVPQLAMAKALAKKNYQVALSGDGADELFGGYRRAKEYDSQYSDTFIELPYYHLPRLDRLMMNQTIELRSPYLAPQIVQHAMTLPWNQRTEKQALKAAFKDVVPPAILSRAKHPLKTAQVIKGGLEYRQVLIDLWRNHI